MKAWHHLTILFIVIFGTYYFIIIHGDFIHLDDVNLITRLLNAPSFALTDIFFPKKTGMYYRPLVELSYRLDFFVWFDQASGWHLTNVLFHAGNTFLVYVISRVLLSNLEGKAVAAFCSALLYGINPLATESVCWISGRSELILALFLLASFLFYMFFRRGGSYIFLVVAGLLYLCAAMTKETGLILPLLLVALELLFLKETFSELQKKRFHWGLAYFVLLTVAYFLCFRRAAVDTGNMHFAIGSLGIKKVSLYENLLTLFASFGFYIKKILFPYPLNFAIYSINLLFYGLFGLSVLILCFVALRSMSPPVKFFCLWIIITILPAMAAAVFNMPWVPWAERYLYVPLIGFSIATAMIFTFFKIRYPAGTVLLLSILLAIFWSTTLYRVFIWADEVRLWENTAKQSDFAPVYYLYGKSLINNKREPEGIEQVKKATAKGFRYDPYMTLSYLALKKGDYQESDGWLKKAIHDFPNNPELHKYLAENYLAQVNGMPKNRLFLSKAIDEYRQYATMRKDDAASYLKIAQLYKANQQKTAALPYLEKTIQIAPGSQAAITAIRYLRETEKQKE